MISVEMIDELLEDENRVYDDDFLKEIPNACLIRFLEASGWEEEFSNLVGVQAQFFGLCGDCRRVVIPSNNKDWIDTAIRWEHNINVLTSIYNINRYLLIMSILES